MVSLRTIASLILALGSPVALGAISSLTSSTFAIAASTAVSTSSRTSSAASVTSSAVPSTVLNQTDQVIANINNLINMSHSLSHAAQSLKFLDSAQFLCDKGGFPEIVSSMANMTTTVHAYLNQMTGDLTFPAGVVSQKIVDRFAIFADVEQRLLNVLIGKAGIFGLVAGIGAPIISAFSDLEEIIDFFVASLSTKLQTGDGSIRARTESLLEAFDLAKNAYHGLNVNEKRSLRFARRSIDAAP